MMWRRIHEIIVKEFRQTLREPKMRVLLVFPPLFQLLVFGYAVNLDVEDSMIAWLDRDRTASSRDLAEAFDASIYFRITETPTSEREAQDLLDRGEVSAIVAVMPGFERDIERNTTAAVQILIDGTNSNTASVVSAYASRVVSGFSARYFGRRQRSLQMKIVDTTGIDAPRYATLPSVKASTRVWFNEDLRSRNYFVPGILVNIITIVTLMLTAMAIVRERELGTMEQLMVTPIRPIELMLGKTIPFGIVGLLQTALVTIVALLLFRVPFRGDPLVLFLGTVLFLMTTLGSGLFISTVSDTQQQALLGSFMFFMPAFMLSDFTFPIRNMPLPVQYLSYLNPVRYFMEVVRGLFLKGVGIETLWPQLLTMFAFGSLIVLISAMRFHKRLD